MFKVTTRPPTSALFPDQDDIPSTHRRHPAEMAGMMDVDNDLGEGPSTLAGVVTPGEIIVSAKEYMRYVFFATIAGIISSENVWLIIKGATEHMSRMNQSSRALLERSKR
jgi:hypothetical protein